MTGEVSIGGVFVPTLLILAVAAILIGSGLVRLLNAFGLHRFFTYRALVDLAIFVLVLGALAALMPALGIRL
jgi:hypothetical protein